MMTLCPGSTQWAARAVHADHAASRLAGDDVGLEAVAVVDIDDLHLLVLQDARRAGKLGVHGDGADIVELGLHHRARWIFPFRTFSSMGYSPSSYRKLSMRRVLPM